MFIKAHNIIKDNMMFSVTPHRAIYEENNNTISLSRLGYLTMDFIPYEMTDMGRRSNYKERDTFIMTMKNIGEFLKIDDTYREGEEPVILNYSAFNSPQSGPDARINVLKVEKKLMKEDETEMLYYEISYMHIRGENIGKIFTCGSYFIYREG